MASSTYLRDAVARAARSVGCPDSLRARGVKQSAGKSNYHTTGGIVVIDPPSGLGAQPDGRMLLVHKRNTFGAV